MMSIIYSPDSSWSGEGCCLCQWSFFCMFSGKKMPAILLYELFPEFIRIPKNLRVDFSGLCAALPRSSFNIEWRILSASGSAPVRQPSVVTSPKVTFPFWGSPHLISIQWRSIKAHPSLQMTFSLCPLLLSLSIALDPKTSFLSSPIGQSDCLLSWEPKQKRMNYF